MLRGTGNFYFILITFSSKLELVLINVGFHMTSIRKSEYQGDIASKMKQLCYLIRTSHWVEQVISDGGIDDGKSNTSCSI